MKFAFPFLSPLSFVSISQPYHLPRPFFLFPFHTVPLPALLLTSYQDLYAFNFRLGRLQSFVSKANNILYLSLAFLLPEALHSLAQPRTAERNVSAQFSLRHYVGVPTVRSAYRRFYTHKVPSPSAVDMLLVP